MPHVHCRLARQGRRILSLKIKKLQGSLESDKALSKLLQGCPTFCWTRAKVNSSGCILLKTLAMSSFNQNIYLEGTWSNYLCLTSLQKKHSPASYGGNNYTRFFFKLQIHIVKSWFLAFCLSTADNLWEQGFLKGVSGIKNFRIAL